MNQIELKKILFNSWLINVIGGACLFLVYRIVISETKYERGNLIDSLLEIVDIVLNLAYSFAYLVAIVFSSCAIFLNLIRRVRGNIYLSFLTFSGIPLIGVMVIAFIVVSESLLHHNTAFRNLLVFSFGYLMFTTFQFLHYRRKSTKF